MRKIIICLALTGIFVGGSAQAQAQRSTDEFLNAIQSAPCANGEPRDPDGVCPTVADKSKGFSLFLPPAAGAKGGHATAAEGAASRPVRTASSAVRHGPIAAPRSSALSDLRITFKLGSADLTEQGKATAENFARALKSLPQTHFEIAGYTDVSGTAQRNRELSEARAQAVKAFLVSQGVDESRLQAKGYGADNLAVPSNPTSPANRRVEAHTLN